MLRFPRLIMVSVAAAALMVPQPSSAQDGGSILVVANTASADSLRIVEAYSRARTIPAQNIVRLTTSVLDEIDHRQFDVEIERPIGEWISRHDLQDRILYIVLTKGIPLRIAGTRGIDGTTSSVDSELTLLYRKLLGISVPPGGRVENPYFLGDEPVARASRFSHRQHDIYLVTRLDGYSLSDVLQLIDRAAAPSQAGRILLDQKNVATSRSMDTWLEAAASRLEAEDKSGVNVGLGPTVNAGESPVLGYYSAGSDDEQINTRKLGYKWAPGAIAAMYLSTDARTFKRPPDTWTLGKWPDTRSYFEGSPQSLIGDLIRDGVTGISGHVAEPYRDAAIRPQVLFPAYFKGLNLAESFYLAMPYLGWQTVVIGDPLCAPFPGERLAAGDAAPPVDGDTGLPQFFAGRRLEVLSRLDITEDVAKLTLKAHAALLKADLRGARAALEEVTRRDPRADEAMFVLAGVYERSGEIDLAIQQYRKILETKPADVRSLNNLAYLLAIEKKAPSDALALAEKAYRIAFAREIRSDAGIALVPLRGTPQDVMPFGAPALEVAASRPRIADTLGWVHHLLGHAAEAEEYLTQASEGAPNNVDIQLHLAVFAASHGRKDQARRALDKALSLDPALEGSREVAEIRQLLERN
jgi:uncharacterized protein (TIGR03790 family)